MDGIKDREIARLKLMVDTLDGAFKAAEKTAELFIKKSEDLQKRVDKLEKPASVPSDAIEKLRDCLKHSKEMSECVSEIELALLTKYGRAQCDAEDAARLDWLVDNGCSVNRWKLNDKYMYRMAWPNGDTQAFWHTSARQAIDAARGVV